LKIVDVAADSAAERAGLRADDRVVAIGGTPVSAKSLAEWRKLLRESPAGTKLAIRFRRNDRDNDATLTLADRIPPVARQ
jgi:C-terminal processing protease CtpA/Prc